MQTIYIDISSKGVVPTIYAKQGDIGRKFEVIFTNSGLPYTIPADSVFSVWYSGESGEGNYTNIGDNSAFYVNENKVTVELITQMLTNDGNGILCIVLNESNGNQIGSWNIPYLCEKVPGIESEAVKEYYTAFSKSVEKLKQVTENLTPEAIGAAPAGYGLGVFSPKLIETTDELDACREGGFYRYGILRSSVANVSVNYGSLIVYPVHTDSCVQELRPIITNYMMRRCWDGGKDEWGEWEIDNPPMELEKEYRTTERYNDAPVYTMLADLGATTESMSTTISASGITALIRAVPIMNNAVVTEWDKYSGANQENRFYFCPEKNRSAGVAFYISCGANRVGKNLKVQIWYTK